MANKYQVLANLGQRQQTHHHPPEDKLRLNGLLLAVRSQSVVAVIVGGGPSSCCYCYAQIVVDRFHALHRNRFVVVGVAVVGGV